MTILRTAGNVPTGAPENVLANKPTTARSIGRLGLYALALAISLFFIVPIYLIAVSAFSPQAVIFAYPKSLLPAAFSADTMAFFLNASGVKEALLNSVVVGIMTLALSLIVGAPAGYALARFIFPGRDSFKLMILTTRAFRGQDGKFDATRFEMIAQQVLMPEGFSKSQIEQFLVSEVRARKIAALLASTIPPTPAEIKSEFIRERLTTEASYVVFKAADFRAAQKVTEDEIKQHYETKKDLLKSPEMRKVRFAAFALPPTADGKPMDAAAKTEQLQKLANDAYDFALALQKPGVNFDEAAKAAGATVGETAEFFARDAGPAELEGSALAASAAFALTKEKPYSSHLALDKGTYVLAFKETKAPEQLPLEKVRQQLEQELMGVKADEAMGKKAIEIRGKLAATGNSTKPFAEAAKSLGIQAVAFPAFSAMQRVPPGTEYADIIQNTARKLAPGEISDVVPTEGAALIVHVDQRPAVDEKDMAEATANIAASIQSSRQMMAFEAWLADRREAAGLKPPKGL